jgi:hypothetical protein
MWSITRSRIRASGSFDNAPTLIFLYCLGINWLTSARGMSMVLRFETCLFSDSIGPQKTNEKTDERQGSC